MPRQQGLLLRGNRWFSNFKAPKEPNSALGKTHFREALGTSDYREACRKVAYERARATALFENTRRTLSAAEIPAAKTEKTVLVAIAEKDAYAMSVRYLSKLEHKCKTWMREEGRFLERHELEEMASNVKGDAIDLATGEEFRGKPLDGTLELQAFLKAENIECAPTSPAFQTLRPLFFEAHLEFLGRYQDTIEGNPIQERNPLFKGVHSQSVAVAANVKGTTVNDLLALRQREILALNFSQKTGDAAKNTARLMRERKASIARPRVHDSDFKNTRAFHLGPPIRERERVVAECLL
jgi:hypothetical protein